MIINNREELSTTDLRRGVLEILDASIEALSPENILGSVSFDNFRKILQIKDKKFKLVRNGRIFVIGGGKATLALAKKIEDIIPDLETGIVNCKTSEKLRKIKVVKACHPIPCGKSVSGVRRMFGLKERYNIGKNDIVLCLISGGASSLMACPAEDLSLREIKKTDRLLINSGANINEINIVRKHLSGVKGGKLAEFFAPAKVVSLILSDVIGDDFGTIASGPTTEDSSTYDDAYETLKKYDLTRRIPRKVLRHVILGLNGKKDETPKRLHNSYNFLIGNNNLALNAMSRKAKDMGFKPFVIKGQKGDCEETAKKKIQEIMDGKYKKFNAIIVGGETTLHVPKNHGTGGRNQYYALVTLQEILRSRNGKNLAMASLGTDGLDYIDGVAGAIIDHNSSKGIIEKGLRISKSIEKCDSYNFFKRLGGSLIRAEPTGTNVADVAVYLMKQ